MAGAALMKATRQRHSASACPEGPAHTGWLGLVMASGDMWPRVAFNIVNDGVEGVISRAPDL